MKKYVQGVFNTVLHHLLSPLRLNVVFGGRGDFLCFKGEICLEMKGKQDDRDHGIKGGK